MSEVKEKTTGKPCCAGECNDVECKPEPPVTTSQPVIEPAAVRSVTARLTPADRWGGVKARWGFGRMKYLVEPGIYALGNPDEHSIVLVSANYKLSFDALRRELPGRDAWILVLDTRGINVWCAAGKGTFGTAELVRRIGETGLTDIVAHRKLIVPQLGAPGISAHEVKQRSGFSVVYGPVRAADIPDFLDAGMKTTPEMRRVHFSLWDRARVVPVEVTVGGGKILLIMAAFFLLSGLNAGGYSFPTMAAAGLQAVILLAGAYFAGTVAGPLLLPFLPGRSFAVKGFGVGVLFFALFVFVLLPGLPVIETAAWFLLMSATASFLVMNFTGSSTYTSLSGVKREMKLAVPIQIAAAGLGMLLWLAGRFI